MASLRYSLIMHLGYPEYTGAAYSGLRKPTQYESKPSTAIRSV